MLDKLTVTGNKVMPLWRHLMRALTAVWLLSGWGSPAMADEISVTSTFLGEPGSCTSPTDAIVPGVGCFSRPIEQEIIWAEAVVACNNMGNNFALPNQDQLSALYAAYPSNGVNDTFGWPLDTLYWTSTMAADESSHQAIDLKFGEVTEHNDSSLFFVACIKADFVPSK